MASSCNDIIDLGQSNHSCPVGGGQFLTAANLPAVTAVDQLVPLLDQLQQQRITLICYREKPDWSAAAAPLPLSFWQQLSAAVRQRQQLLLAEIDSPEQLELLLPLVDVVEVAATQMNNQALLSKLAALRKPVLLQRGIDSDISSWLCRADWLRRHGCDRIILGEQGYRLMGCRQTLLDIAHLHQIKRKSSMPLLVDLGQCCDDRQVLTATACSLAASNVDGMIVPVNRQDNFSGFTLGPEERSELLDNLVTFCRFFQRPLTLLPPVAAASRPSSATIKVAFQGEMGAYSQQAILSYFASQSVVVQPCESFAEVFQLIRTRAVDAGMLPLENTLGGTLLENYALLRNYQDLEITGELRLRIRHNLIVPPGSTLQSLTIVRSHPQALAQCAAFIGHYQLKKEAVWDTAGAVKQLAASPQPGVAAIAGTQAAREYQMEILQSAIETNHHNYTRFVLIQRRGEGGKEGADKVSLVLTTKHQAGSLAQVLNILHQQGFDLSKLESDPIAGDPWRYRFFIDALTPKQYDFANLQATLRDQTNDLHQLGHYREDLTIHDQ